MVTALLSEPLRTARLVDAIVMVSPHIPHECHTAALSHVLRTARFVTTGLAIPHMGLRFAPYAGRWHAIPSPQGTSRGRIVDLFETVRIAVEALTANKLRSSL